MRFSFKRRFIVCTVLFGISVLGRGMFKYVWIILSDIIWVLIMVVVITTLILSINNLKVNLILNELLNKSTFI